MRDENLNLPREEYEPVVSRPVDLEFMGAEVVLSVFDIEGDHEIRTCYGKYLGTTKGSSIGGGYWKYTSNNGLTGTAYCVNHGLRGVSPSKALTVQPYNREPKTMGAFANGYPNRTLAQFKELHASDVRGIASLTEDEYKYATQLAVWATCGQLAVPDTAFSAGRDTLKAPTSDAQQIRIFDSVKAILRLANGWTKYLYTGLSLRAEEDKDVRGVEVLNEYGLEGAAEDNEDGIKKERINGKEYYTRVMYVSSATSAHRHPEDRRFPHPDHREPCRVHAL